MGGGGKGTKAIRNPGKGKRYLRFDEVGGVFWGGEGRKLSNFNRQNLTSTIQER